MPYQTSVHHVSSFLKLLPAEFGDGRWQRLLSNDVASSGGGSEWGVVQRNITTCSCSCASVNEDCHLAPVNPPSYMYARLSSSYDDGNQYLKS